MSLRRLPKFSGAPFRAVLPTNAADVQMTGQPQHYVKVADSGNHRDQVFCAICGTQLYATDPTNPTVFNFRLGCIDQRCELAPQMQIWTRSAMPWLKDLSLIEAREMGMTT